MKMSYIEKIAESMGLDEYNEFVKAMGLDEEVDMNEKIKRWLEEFKSSGIDINKEIEQVEGEISNETLWMAGSYTKEEEEMHRQNIIDLVEYIEVLNNL